TRHDWETRTGKHPEDMALQTLHALWLGLCTKVQAGELTTAQADEIFESVRRSFIERRGAQLRNVQQRLADEPRWDVVGMEERSSQWKSRCKKERLVHRTRVTLLHESENPRRSR